MCPAAQKTYAAASFSIFSVFSTNSILDANILQNSVRTCSGGISPVYGAVMADYGRVDPGEFPLAVAASSKSIVDEVLLPLFEKIKEQVNFERVIIVPFSGKPLHGNEDCSTQFGTDTEVDAGPLPAVGPLPAEDRFGVGRYPFRVRMWYFFRSPTSCTLIERHPRLGFGLG
jgi:hypothetical protein